MVTLILTKYADPYSDIPYNVDIETLRLVQELTKDIVGFILGLAAGLIIVGMFLITVMDLCYINIPPLQDFVHNKNWDGSVSNGKKFKLVSKDAVCAVRESCLGERNASFLYFGKRLKSYVICAIILYIIIGGSQVIVDISVYLLSGLLDLLNVG